jgi:hypothetical protein
MDGNTSVFALSETEACLLESSDRSELSSSAAMAAAPWEGISPEALSPAARAPATGDLLDHLRDQLAEHAGLMQDTLQVLLEQRDTAFLAELASLREHNRDLQAALSANRADQQFSREMVEQCLQSAIAQRDRMLHAAVASLQEQQTAGQQSVEGMLQGHLDEWRKEVPELHRRLDEAIASETEQREAALAVQREQLTLLREYQHDRDLRTEALLKELVGRTASTSGSGAGWWSGICRAIHECYWRVRGR